MQQQHQRPFSHRFASQRPSFYCTAWLTLIKQLPVAPAQDQSSLVSTTILEKHERKAARGSRNRSKAAIRLANRDAQRRRRARFTEAERAASQAADALRHRQRRAGLSEAEKAAERAANTRQHKERRAALVEAAKAKQQAEIPPVQSVTEQQEGVEWWVFELF